MKYYNLNYKLPCVSGVSNCIVIFQPFREQTMKLGFEDG